MSLLFKFIVLFLFWVFWVNINLFTIGPSICALLNYSLQVYRFCRALYTKCHQVLGIEARDGLLLFHLSSLLVRFRLRFRLPPLCLLLPYKQLCFRLVLPCRESTVNLILDLGVCCV